MSNHDTPTTRAEDVRGMRPSNDDRHSEDPEDSEDSEDSEDPEDPEEEENLLRNEASCSSSRSSAAAGRFLRSAAADGMPSVVTSEHQKTRGFFADHKCVILRHTNSTVPYVFRDVTDLNERLADGRLPQREFDDAVYVYVYERSKRLPERWPRSMQTLDVRFSLCPDHLVPPFPPSLRSITFMKCAAIRTFDVPAVCAACPLVEDIVLYGCAVRSLHPTVAAGATGTELRLLDVSYCPVHDVDVLRLPASITTLAVEGNVRDDERTPVVLPFDRTRLRPELTIVYASFALATVTELGATTPSVPVSPHVFRGIWENSHNVHVRGIQDSTSTSMTALTSAYGDALALLREQRGTDVDSWTKHDEWLQDCRAAYTKIPGREQGYVDDSTWNKMTSFFKKRLTPKVGGGCISDGEWRFLFDAYMDDSFAHSTHALTMREMLKRVWTIITVHPSRDELMRVLVDEMRAGKRFCFTGRFTRLVNVLCGFVDGVTVGISGNEQLRNRLSVLWKKLDVAPSTDKELVDGILRDTCDSVLECLSTESDGAGDDGTGVRFPEWETVQSWVMPFADAAEVDVQAMRTTFHEILRSKKQQ